MKFSIIIPTLNEAEVIQNTLQPLQKLRQQGHQIILVDGSSTDNTKIKAEGLVDRLISSTQGRAQQMNEGARIADHDTLLFLHADTLLPDNATDAIQSIDTLQWGRFDLNIAGQHYLLPVIAFFINLRSRITGIATGDQAIFIRKDLFKEAGEFPKLPLMEDIALCQQLLGMQRPTCLKARVTTSGRRWEKHGVFRTIFLMWALRLGYFLGIKPAQLADFYAPH